MFLKSITRKPKFIGIIFQLHYHIKLTADVSVTNQKLSLQFRYHSTGPGSSDHCACDALYLEYLCPSNIQLLKFCLPGL